MVFVSHKDKPICWIHAPIHAPVLWGLLNLLRLQVQASNASTFLNPFIQGFTGPSPGRQGSYQAIPRHSTGSTGLSKSYKFGHEKTPLAKCVSRYTYFQGSCIAKTMTGFTSTLKFMGISTSHSHHLLTLSWDLHMSDQVMPPWYSTENTSNWENLRGNPPFSTASGDPKKKAKKNHHFLRNIYVFFT